MTEEELNAVKGLMHYLNDQFTKDFDAEIKVGDSNGDTLGVIVRDGVEYKFTPLRLT
jgi:hypothetical protein